MVIAPNKRIVVTGSVAYDYLMTFPGKFTEHLIPDQMHRLSVSFLVDEEQEAVDLVARTRIWTLAESLGGVESLIEHPHRMTHASTAAGPFASPRNLVRLSPGIESADDLVADLDQALRA